MTLHPFPLVDVAIIVALTALNGVFAMSELAIVSARRPRLEAMVRRGRRGAQVALDLGADPGRFLSTVQTGITLIGVLAGAYSGASLGGPAAERLELLGLDHQAAERWGFALVIVATAYVSLIVGELVPKQVALRAPEPIAAAMARPLLWLSRLAAPFVWLLDRSSALIFRLLRLSREGASGVTAEELHLVVAEASSAGVIEESERQIISGVVRLADRPVREVMTPRTEVEWIDMDAGEAAFRQRLAAMPHGRMPLGRGSVDALAGVVQARDVAAALLAGEPLDPARLLRAVPVVPDQMDAMDALQTLRAAEVPLAFVHDEYGHFDGLVTPGDLLAAIAGAAEDADEGEAALVRRDDGSWLVAGSLPADQLAERLGVNLPEDRDYATAAGFALSVLRHLPVTGESFTHDGWRFEVVDMDGRKIDKLLAARR